ncbi:serine/threonine-protein kinase [Roseateles sp.]|uniref:serine/threonine-protein kinase n=1 Tax=Roseateles sp. TaxID=1971397 RepID=UPI0025DE6A79|nr:serine/threonine-protein kinase [Roseateles sp.]MBV8033503.1 serine/threonine protein kinase [Roseateles sp.]
MTPLPKERWLVLSPLLDELLDLDGDARARRLDALSLQDAALADELRALLLQEQALNDGGFLERPVADTLQLDAPPESPVAQGLTIGPYRLERELGQGGMGSVWTAQRVDGRFEGRVAVKFLRAGLFAAGDTGRFAREGQILARLSHPHIARLLDAGVVQGQPYLVLEYVDGQPIDAYCREHGLDIEARVRLFLDVLAAVGHAHARLILHRDLKPSNILVTRSGEVKLLDFGIAKLLDDAGQGVANTELTQLAGHAYTPQYAAPEQVQQSEVTTATDVYALGVLLYQLLGGGHPTAADTQMRLDLLKAVVEQVPRRLSDAARQGADPLPSRQARQLRGDLDTIVAKALKKQPAERYVNAEGLAADLRCWLAHEPIGARPDSRLYVLGRFVRRHRLAVAAGTAAVLLLLASTTASLVQARRAEAAEQQAQARRQQAEDLLSYMLGEFADKLRPIGRLELLDSVGGKALSFLAQDPEGTDRLQRAKALTVIGEVRVSKRELAAAMEPLQAASALLQGEPPEPTLTADWRKAQGAAHFWIGQVQLLQRDHDGARLSWEAYRRVSEAWLKAQPQSAEAQVELSYAHTNLGSLALATGRLGEVEAAFAQATDIKRRVLERLEGERRIQVLGDFANDLSWQGQAKLWQGEFTAAVKAFEEALGIVETLQQGQPADAQWAHRLAVLQRWLGLSSLQAGQAYRAPQLLASAVRGLEKLVERDPANRSWQADLLVAQLHAADALPAADRQRMLRERLPQLTEALERAEAAGGEATRLRRLTERARWARLRAETLAATPAEAARLLDETVLQLRKAWHDRPTEFRLARALAETEAAALRYPGKGAQRDARCADVVSDFDGFRELLRMDYEVTRAWLELQPCWPESKEVQTSTTRDWLATRR